MLDTVLHGAHGARGDSLAAMSEMCILPGGHRSGSFIDTLDMELS